MNIPLPANPLAALKFDNSFTRELRGDPIADNYRRQVPGACYSFVDPTPVSQPGLVAFSREAAALIDLQEPACRSEKFLATFSGNSLEPGMQPFAMCYGGHQFGSWAGQLGDGRAINLGETVNRRGERWTLQLKGAGPTPYSRNADGLAVLRSSIREFLCSEAMYHLGIPTTRALSVVTTGENVIRDMFYDGHPKAEPGAVVCRLSPSFLRFGNFEIHHSRNESALLRQLVDYTITTDFPHLGNPSVATYTRWFEEVCRRTAELILHWMRVGFVHGVMNTDNMSILGLTIDYGPYGWLEGYDAGWTPNTTDAQGRRYCFGNQPHIGQWNLMQLASAVYPLLGRVEPLKEALNEYNNLFQQGWNSMMAEKIGLRQFRQATDDTLIGELIDLLQVVETDMTIFFRSLGKLSTDEATRPDPARAPVIPQPLQSAYYQPDQLTKDYTDRLHSWLSDYRQRLVLDNRSDTARREQMDKVNPKYVLRNYLAQQAIEKAETGDSSMVVELLDLLRRPYDEQPDREHYFARRPEWARNRPGCSMLSCSS